MYHCNFANSGQVCDLTPEQEFMGGVLSKLACFSEVEMHDGKEGLYEG
jgi:hypothetical protein